jgi:glutaredoxin
MKTKQTNTWNGLKEFLRPSWGKLISSIIFLVIFFLLPYLGLLLKIRFIIIFWSIVMIIASFSLYPIIKALGLTTTSPIYFDAFGGPTMFGLFLIAFFWVTILYFVSCLVVYLRKRKHGKEQHYQKKIITKKEAPKAKEIKIEAKPSKWWYLLPIFLSIIGGVIGYFLLGNRDKKFALRLLIIGFITFAVLIILQVIFAGLMYLHIGGVEVVKKKDAKVTPVDITSPYVKVYSAPNCPHCNRVKTFLQQNRIEFEDMDIENNPKAAKELKSKTGTLKLPAVEINGEIIIGYNEEKMRELLHITEEIKPKPPEPTPKPSLSWVTYTEPNFRFSFAYPEDWTKETKGNVIFIKGPVDEKGFIPNVNIQVVVSAELGGAYKNIDEAATKLLRQLSAAENYNLISDTQTTIDNEDAREITTSYSYNNLDIKQGNTYVQDPNAGTIYIIGYTATTASYSKHLGVYEKVKETFKLPK